MIVVATLGGMHFSSRIRFNKSGASICLRCVPAVSSYLKLLMIRGEGGGEIKLDL